MAARLATQTLGGPNGLRKTKYSLQKPSYSRPGQYGLYDELDGPVEAATFRFLDLPTELRLIIYAELLERNDPDSPKRLFPNILATSQEINREASPELYAKTTLRLTIAATALKSRDWITNTSLHIGKHTRPFFATGHHSNPITPAWNLYQSFPLAFSKVVNMTLQIVLTSHRHKGLLRPILIAEQFNQIYQILVALAAIWNGSGELRMLKIEFLDDTGSVQAPISPPAQMVVSATRQMQTNELKRLFDPLRVLGEGVAINASAVPFSIMEHITNRRAAPPSSHHPFQVYTSLAARVGAVVAKIKDAGLCCTQIGSIDQKPCGIRSLEKKMAIARDRILDCKIRSQRKAGEMMMDMDAVDHFLESRKVREMVSKAGGYVQLCSSASIEHGE